MPLVRRVVQTGLEIVGSTLRLVFGTAADQPAAGNHDHSTTYVGATGVATTYRGGAVLQRTAVAATPHTLSAGEYLLGVTVSGAATINLTENAPAGRVVIVKDERGTAASANITVSRSGSDTIDGATSVVIATNYGSAAFYSDGANWWTV